MRLALVSGSILKKWTAATGNRGGGGGGGRGRGEGKGKSEGGQRVSLPDPTLGAVIIFLFCLLLGKKTVILPTCNNASKHICDSLM